MKYYIIFGITIISALFICFYNPNDKYLGIYKDSMYIEYFYNDKNYEWIYDSSDNLKIERISNSKWKIYPINDGSAKLSFYYINDEDIVDTKYTINYEFNIKKNKIYWINGNAKGLVDFPNPY